MILSFLVHLETCSASLCLWWFCPGLGRDHCPPCAHHCWLTKPPTRLDFSSNTSTKKHQLPAKPGYWLQLCGKWKSTFDQVRLAIGAAGGTKITTAVAQVFVSYLWAGEWLMINCHPGHRQKPVAQGGHQVCYRLNQRGSQKEKFHPVYLQTHVVFIIS